jgi:hypothetical protein
MSGFFYPALFVILVVALGGLAIATAQGPAVPAVPLRSYTDPASNFPGT